MALESPGLGEQALGGHGLWLGGLTSQQAQSSLRADSSRRQSPQIAGEKEAPFWTGRFLPQFRTNDTLPNVISKQAVHEKCPKSLLQLL